MKALKYLSLSSQCSEPLFGLLWNFIPVYDQFEFWAKSLWWNLEYKMSENFYLAKIVAAT